MIFQSIIKFIPALLYSVVFLGLFYWQFVFVNHFIINKFMESKLIAQQGYLFIYFFLILIIAISTINILQKYLIKEKSFVIITIVTLLTFYILAFDIFYNPIEFFIKLSLPSTTITGMIFFMILSFGYGLYSLGILYFKDSMPINHILIFLFLGVFYSVGFIHYYCMPLF